MTKQFVTKRRATSNFGPTWHVPYDTFVLRIYMSVRNVVPTLTSNKRRGLSLNGRC
jgi:hypothetical protein